MIRRLIILLLIVGCVFAREYIAIIDFEGIGVNNDEARALTQRLTSELITLQVYQVVERSEMKRLLDEQKFQYSGCVDTKCAVEIGKMIGAKYMVVGSISKIDDVYTIDTRLINVESSEAYASGQYTAQESLSNVLVNGMKSIAYQLSEIDEDVPRISIINKDINRGRNIGLEFGYGEYRGHGEYNEVGSPEGIFISYSWNFRKFNTLKYKISYLHDKEINNPAFVSFGIKKNFFINNINLKIGLGGAIVDNLSIPEHIVVNFGLFYNFILLKYYELDIGFNRIYGFRNNNIDEEKPALKDYMDIGAFTIQLYF